MSRCGNPQVWPNGRSGPEGFKQSRDFILHMGRIKQGLSDFLSEQLSVAFFAFRCPATRAAVCQAKVQRGISRPWNRLQLDSD